MTCEGWPYLGVAIGTDRFAKEFIAEKVKEWSAEVLLLAKIAESQPHAAYSALTHGLSSRWWYVILIAECLQPLEEILCILLPTLLGSHHLMTLFVICNWLLCLCLGVGWKFSILLCYAIRNILLHLTSLFFGLAALVLYRYSI